jgi:hypothetical protein
MTDVKQENPIGTQRYRSVKIIRATLQMEVIRGPYMPILNFPISHFSEILINSKFSFCCQYHIFILRKSKCCCHCVTHVCNGPGR